MSGTASGANTSCGSATPLKGKRPKLASGAVEGRGEVGRAQERPVELLREPLEPAHEVDRRPQHGEVEAVGAADVAVNDLADVQGGDERQGCSADLGLGEGFAGIVDGPKRRTAGGGPAARRLDRENRENAVAQELQHVAAVAPHGLDHRLEVAIERSEQLRLAQALAHRREAAQVRKQDRRLDMAAVAAPDRARQHGIRRPLAQERAQQARRRAPHGGRLQRGGERLAQVLDQLEMPVRKAVLAVAHEAERLHRAIAILERHGQIVGAAGRRHLMQHLMVALGIEPLEAPAKGRAPLDHELEGAAEKGIGRKHGPRHQVFAGTGTARPDDAPGACQRVGEPLPGAQPPERHAAFRQLLAERFDQPHRIQREPRVCDQPSGNRRRCVVMSLVHVSRSRRGVR